MSRAVGALGFDPLGASPAPRALAGARGARPGERQVTARRLGTPRPAVVRVGADGLPAAVGRRAVDCVREDWVVEDRWWARRPLRRRYFELVLVDGRDVVVFHDLVGGGWFEQRS